MREIADGRIDGCNCRAPIDHALGNITPRIYSKAKEDRRMRRPRLQKIAGKVAPAHHWACKVRRLEDAFPAPARPIPSASAPGPRPCSASSCPEPWNAGRALGRSSAGTRRLACKNTVDGRCYDLGLWSDDGRRFALDVPRRRSALLESWFQLLARSWRRRRRRRGREIKNAQRLLRVAKVKLARKMEEGEEQCHMDRRDEHNRTRPVTAVDVTSIGHASG